MSEPETKTALLERVANAYDMGLLTPERLRLMERWLDFVMRLEGGQLSAAIDFLVSERERNGVGVTGAIGNLAGDADGYALQHLAAILTHPCQACAVDPRAWHTRSAFCEHRKR